MKTVIVGAGKVGSILCEQLASENHDIAVIDVDADAVRAMTDRFDVMGIIGNGATVEIQREAGVASADLLIAASPLDEINLLACIVARRLGARHTIARVRNPEYASQMEFLKTDLGLSMTINPELEAAAEISRVMRYPAALKISPFARGRAELIEIKLEPGNPIIGISLMALRAKYQIRILVGAVLRGEEVFIPKGDFILREGDRVVILGAPRDVNAFFGKIGILTGRTKSVMIVGGGRICYYLTRQLLTMGVSVKIIEQDADRCRELCETLPDATVICGNGSNQELLISEGLTSTGAFVALTGLDEENMIIAMYAHETGVKKVLAKVNNENLPVLMQKMGLDTVISPKRITANGIIRYARAMQNNRGGSIETLYKLLDDRAEAIDFRVKADAPIIGKPLKDFKFKPQTLIACVVRRGQPQIADGSTVIEAGDDIIVISGREMLTKIKDIIE
ncbi:MAG: Trk system potassium transporter TrkA [Clostridia bacterium]|nr:Trk system potassium transporter TrkA [Clostridia bacterium]